MWQAEHKLYIYPIDPNISIPKVLISNFLEKEEFTGDIIERRRFSTGTRFLSHLTFMGCSPNIELDPQEDKPYCYIEIESHTKASFVFGSNQKKSRCHYCKNEIQKPFFCPHCQKTLSPNRINWRKTAFVATCWILVGNIYEREAIPNDQFLDTLAQETGVKWKIAYIRETT